jgi:hypothetical protein
MGWHDTRLNCGEYLLRALGYAFLIGAAGYCWIQWRLKPRIDLRYLRDETLPGPLMKSLWVCCGRSLCSRTKHLQLLLHDRRP